MIKRFENIKLNLNKAKSKILCKEIIINYNSFENSSWKETKKRIHWQIVI